MSKASMSLRQTCVAQFVAFIIARHDIYLKRAAGLPKPWTTDPILLDYKFCNVYRELDKTTVWLTDNWRTPHADDPDLWFAMVVARLLNRPSTLEELGYPARWKAGRFIRLVHRLREEKIPAFSGAYMISTHGTKMDKAQFLADVVLTLLWKHRAYIRPRIGDTLEAFAGRLREHHGMGSFLSAQVVADVKYVEPLRSAEDWWSWAASGPGSRRGMNRLLGKAAKPASWNEEKWLGELGALHCELTDNKAYCKARDSGKLPMIHAQDLQNCLCEFDKWCRVFYGEGRMKSRYSGRV